LPIQLNLQEKKMKVCLVFGVFLSLAGAAYAQTTDSGLADGSLRKLCYGSSQETCTILPYAEAAKQQSLPLPQAVEEAYKKSYLPLTTAIETTAGLIEETMCGSLIADEVERLIVASLHCVPPYANQVSSNYMHINGIPLTLVAKIPDADLALLQANEIPEGKEEAVFAEAVVQEAIYGRSVQQNQMVNISTTKTATNTPYFQGPISLYGSVTAKGTIGSSRYFSGTETQRPTYDVFTTPYEVLRVSGQAEPGFSGAPIFNQWGQVVGIVMAGLGTPPGSTGASFYAISAKNFSLLLEMYRSPHQ
jgi:hypothetical protein